MTTPMRDSATPRSSLIVERSPTGISSVVIAKNVASPSTAIPTIAEGVSTCGVPSGPCVGRGAGVSMPLTRIDPV
jgi:hypothetical protein